MTITDDRLLRCKNDYGIRVVALMLFLVIFYCVDILSCIWVTPIDLAAHAVTLASIMLFGFLIVIGMLGIQWYARALPFVLLAFPMAINNIFPEVYIGSVDDNGAAPYPLFYHIEGYLLLGLIRYQKQITNSVGIPYILVALVAMVLLQQFILASYYEYKIENFLVMVAGHAYLRIIILLSFVVYLIPGSRNINDICIGLIISVIFLTIESSLFTYTHSLERLTSGSLGNNAFGIALASVVIFLIYHRFNIILMDWSRFLAITIGVCCILLTGTRVAVIALVFSYIFVEVVKGKCIKLTMLLALAFCAIVFLWEQWEVDGRIISIFMLAADLVTGEIEYSELTSSLYTRFELYVASLKMIQDNPVLGIGMGMWDYLKFQYGVNFDVMLDPHNGYLAYLAQYGLIIGTLFITFYLVRPLVYFLRNRKVYAGNNSLLAVSVVPIVFLLSEITNASTMKVNVFSFLMFMVLIVYYENGSLKRKRRMSI